MRRHSDKYGIGILSELNVTPLLDLAFVLLVIFMIAAPLLSKDEAKANMGEFSDVSPGSVRVINIGLDKGLEIDGVDVAWKDLPGNLESMVKADSEVGVLVESHRTLPAQDLIQLMGAVRAAGVKDFGVVTEEASRP